MHKSVSHTIVLAAFAAIAGCATSNTSTTSSRYAKLPTGVTLLDTDSGRCAGAVQVREEQGGRSHDSELSLKPGENATFAVAIDDGDRLEWSCIGESRTVNNRVDCPDATSHVRISRRAAGDDLTLECYGRRNGRS
jgi:hypothetical protein